MGFDGSSSYITVPHSESLRLLNQGDFTVAAWFKPDALPSENKEVVQQGDGTGTGRTWLFVAGDAEIRAYLGGGTTGSGVYVEADTWYHAAAVVTELGATDSVQVYVDGQPAGAAGEFGMEDADGEYFIGCHKNVTNLWDGLIDDVRLYNRALTNDEIAAMVPPKLKAYDPAPPDGDVTVVTALFQWTAGDTALLHDVYLGTDPGLGPDDLMQSRMPMTLYYHVAGLTPGTTYYWRVDEIEADMTTVHAGDVWSFVARPFTAYLPDPADGANEAAPDPNLALTWQPGREVIEHHLYFGARFDDVNDRAANTDKGPLAEAVWVLPDPLSPLTTYYWGVDETAVDGTVRTGQVWSFTTFLAVEDFESYTDNFEAGEAIFQTWIDGVENGTGSYVGYEVAANGTFGETTMVHSGGQSMPLDYNNVNSPYYSETSRTWATPQNFTANGANALVLYVSGNLTNAPEPLYVGLEDTAMRVGVVVHPDSTIMGTRAWTRWEIPLSTFSDAGVSLTAIKAMMIGLGDRDNPTPGGAGLIFVDDIRIMYAEPAVE